MSATLTEVLVADTDGMDVAAAYDRLQRAGFAVRVLESRDPREIADAGRTAEALLISSVSVTADMLDAMPLLRLVSCMSTGTDHVDLESAARLGIEVAHLTDASTDSVAAQTLALALAAIRELPESMRIARSGDWSIRSGVNPLEPQRLVLGVVGLGRIGRAFAAISKGVFSRVVGFDVAPETADDPIERLEIGALAATSDVISLHLPSTPETRELIRLSVLPALKPGCVLVNASRGDLVPRESLLRLLDRGILRAAALDVLPDEPPEADDPILLHPRTIVTPHYGFLSDHTARDYPERQVDAVLRFFRRQV